MAYNSTSDESVPSLDPSSSSSVDMASNSTSNQIVQSPSLFSSNAMLSASTTPAFEKIRLSPPDTNAFEPSTSSFEQIEPKNEHSNAFEGIIPSLSSSNTPTMPQRKLSYDVFINHRGPDVKHTLAATLYKTLTDMGLRVFLDEEELELGDFLPAEIQEAMDGASLHIAIFSQNYAESPWCLAELAFMLKIRAQIVPVFYHVEPHVVRYVKGVYAASFSRHEEKGRYTSKLLGEWKNALQIVSHIVGVIVYNEDDEVRVLKNIVNRVLKEIKHVPFEVAKHPVGLDEGVREVERMAIQSAQSHDTVQIVGICGMGGSGKTTLAKQIYNNKYANMDKSSFLFEVRDADSRSKLHEKQKKLLEDLGFKGGSIENIEEGKGILSRRLKSIKVLIILDDVDKVEQLDALVPIRDNLGSDSLIVVTSRDSKVLQSWGILSIYKMKALSPTHARELFCRHTFLQSFPHQGFEDLVQSFLNVCDGLPLSLKVIGAQLYGSNKNDWEALFHKVSRILRKDIIEILKINYDALDDEEKEVFLDIACLFIGESESSAIAAWDGLGLSGLHSWKQLLNKCLVETDGKNRIRMHDHLRDLGRAIAKDQSPYRLWSPHQVINVDNVGQPILLRGIKGMTSGKLIVNTNRGPYNLEPSSLVGLKFLHVRRNCYDQLIGELSRELVWLRWVDIEHSNLQSFKSLKHLRVLELYENFGKHCLKELWETDNNAPRELRELVINGCSEFGGFPKSIGSLKHLKKIVLSGSTNLTSLPEEFCLLQSLEHLDLTRTELSSLPDSFGDLRNLRHLDLSMSANLSSLPDSFGDLTNLTHLVLNRSNLSSLPHSFGDLSNLRHLDLSSAKLSSLIDSFGNLRNLEKSEKLSSLPDSFGDLRNLRHLNLSSNRKLGRLPVSFKELRFLQHLNLQGCSKLTVESDILENMMKLQYLNISDCDQVEELLSHITNQSSLRELYCVWLKRVMEVPVSISQLRKLERMEIGGELLTSLPTSLGDLSSLTSLTISGCANLQCLPDSLGGLSSLTYLEFFCCDKLQCLPDSLGDLSSLTSLLIYDCAKLQCLPDSLGDLSSLTSLTISFCANLKCLPDSLGCLNLLTHLKIKSLGVHSLPKSVGQLVNLKELEIRSCPMSELDLRVSQLTALKDITKVSNISISGDSLPVLITLSLYNNTNLTHIECLPNSLRKIRLVGSPKLEALPSFAQIAFLREFELEGCNRVKKIHGLEHCTALETLTANTCWEEAGIESLERMERLRRVEVKTESRSGVEGCIQSIKKWPGEEMIVCAQAAPDLELSLVKSCIVFANLCVVDSFTEQEMDSKPALKWPGSTGGCILLCYVFNCESPQTSLRATRGGTLELGKAKWVWTGLFTQHSSLHSYMSHHPQSRVEIYVPGKEKIVEASGMVVTGEEERLQQAFSHIWAFRRNS